jgi:predicted lipase
MSPSISTILTFTLSICTLLAISIYQYTIIASLRADKAKLETSLNISHALHIEKEVHRDTLFQRIQDLTQQQQQQQQRQDQDEEHQQPGKAVTSTPPAGVAITTFLGAPKWFQNRYSMMISQVLAVTPLDWKVQIFYNPKKKMALEGIAHSGIARHVASGRVILTGEKWCVCVCGIIAQRLRRDRGVIPQSS